MSTIHRSIWFVVVLALTALLSACSLDSGGTAPPPRQLGGRLTGLDGKVTLFGAGSVVTLTKDGNFIFPRLLAEGEAYDVIVFEQPAAQRCAVQNGTGSIQGGDVTNIEVVCARDLFQVGGTVSGLVGDLELENGADHVTVAADGSFTFPALLQDDAPYAVKVYRQPPGQGCQVQNGTGVITSADVTDITVVCSSDDARLVDLVLSEGTLNPVFSPDTTLYWTEVGLLVQSIAVIPTAAQPASTILVNGVTVVSGMSSLPIPLDLGSNFINIHVTAPSGATMDYAVLVGREEKLGAAYLKASNASAYDLFGQAVALSGDTLVIGASQEDSNANIVNGDQADDSQSNSGAVYVFVRSGDTWAQEAYIKPFNTEVNDNFGWSVAISGDTLVVGAPNEDSDAVGPGGNPGSNGSQQSGAAYVFVRSGTTWTQQAYIKASNTDNDDQFGWAVAISGDTLAVSAKGEDSNAKIVNGDQANESEASSGAVYVFVRSGTMWTQEAYVKASNSDANDAFGSSLVLDGDTLAVGAPGEDSNAVNVGGTSNESAIDSGAAYVFTRTAGMWSQQAYVKASNTDAGDAFGVSLALEADTLVVGASSEDSGAAGINGNDDDDGTIDAGAAYVFLRTGGMWAQNAYVKASNPDTFDNFGASVAVFGDTLAVSADAENGGDTGMNGKQGDNTATDSGAAYLFSRAKGEWSQVGYLKPPNTEAYDMFGGGIALFGDTLVCATHLEDSDSTGVGGNPYDNTALDSGAVFVYH